MMAIEFLGLIGLFVYALWDMKHVGVDWAYRVRWWLCAVALAFLMVAGTNYLIGVLP